MDQVKEENEDDMLGNDQPRPQLNGEGNRGSVRGGVVQKKGPWTEAEDAILIDYVTKHGEGNWNAVQKHSGLTRCGKSCRLRWVNHLRPHLKKGAFSSEEEQMIVELHAQMGNKWARMAAHLPGRTDNEIKNYWNTRSKRRKRAGLPEEEESQHGISTRRRIDDGDSGHLDFFPHKKENLNVVYTKLNDYPGILPIPVGPKNPDISANSFMLNSLHSPPYCNSVPSTVPIHHHLRESTMSYLGSSGTNKDWCYPFYYMQDHTSSQKTVQSFGLHSTFDPGLYSQNSMYYSHSLSNGNSSTSKLISKPVKSELPSNQYPETGIRGWGVNIPSSPLESDDVFNQSSLPLGALDSGCSSPHNSGMLEDIIYQKKTLPNSMNNCSDKSSHSSTATPVDRAESSAMNVNETEWDDYTDHASSFAATSIPDESHAVNTNGNSWHKLSPAHNFSGNIVKYEPVDQDCTPNNENQAMSMLYTHSPDFLLASEWNEQCYAHEMNMTKASDNLADCNNMAGETYSSSTGGCFMHME